MCQRAMWASCTRAVELPGVRMGMSACMASFPPLGPVNAMVVQPMASAVDCAMMQLGALPEVDMPMITSPGFARARVSWAKAISRRGESFSTAVFSAPLTPSGMAASPVSRFSASSSPQGRPSRLETISSLRVRFRSKLLQSSPAMCIESAWLPPFPQRRSLPPLS